MNLDRYFAIKKSIPETVKLVAVSKTKPVEDIESLYQLGHWVFGESKAQELKAKAESLPKDIEWHFIGHLQTNKVKYIAPFVNLIQSVDSFALLREIDKQAKKNNRTISCLLQFHIAKEENKFGFNMNECEKMFIDPEYKNLKNINIQGVMGIATFTDNERQVREEFQSLHSYFKLLQENYFYHNDSFKEISMGMTDDYLIAIEEKSTMIRIGSAIFGERNYKKI